MAYNETRKKATIKYAKKKLKRIPLDVQMEKYKQIKTFVDSTGDTVNGFIKKAIDEKMERDTNIDE